MPRITPADELQLIESIVAAHPGGIGIAEIELAMAQQSGKGGAVLSFELKASDPEQARKRAFHVLDSARTISLCTNLGDVKTLASHPASTSPSP